MFVAYPVWLDDDTARTGSRTLTERATRGRRRRQRVVGRPTSADRVPGLAVLVEVDSGQHRTGVAPVDAGDVAAVARAAGLDVRGVFTFPGHGYAPDGRDSAARDEAAALSVAADSLRARDIEPRVLSGGSTPTLEASLTTGVPTELRPGRLRAQRRPAVGARLGDGRPDAGADLRGDRRQPRGRPGGPRRRRQGARRPTGRRTTRGTARLLDYPDARVVLLSEHHAVVEGYAGPPAAAGQPGARRAQPRVRGGQPRGHAVGRHRRASWCRGRWPHAAATPERAPTDAPVRCTPCASALTLLPAALRRARPRPDRLQRRRQLHGRRRPGSTARVHHRRATTRPTRRVRPRRSSRRRPTRPTPVRSPSTIGTTVGDLNATLDAGGAPCTVNSFVSLADQGYFDDVSCHRMTTAASSCSSAATRAESGAGGPGYSFADELDGTETYGAGTLAMANAGPDTNGSQFFIVYDDSQLPPAYTVFGHVDDAAVATIEKVAKKGVDNANGQGDGAPQPGRDDRVGHASADLEGRAGPPRRTRPARRARPSGRPCTAGRASAGSRAAASRGRGRRPRPRESARRGGWSGRPGASPARRGPCGPVVRISNVVGSTRLPVIRSMSTAAQPASAASSSSTGREVGVVARADREHSPAPVGRLVALLAHPGQVDAAQGLVGGCWSRVMVVSVPDGTLRPRVSARRLPRRRGELSRAISADLTSAGSWSEWIIPAAIPRARYSCEVIGYPSFVGPSGPGSSRVCVMNSAAAATLTFYGCRNACPTRRRRDLAAPVARSRAVAGSGCMTTPTREIHLASRPFGWPTPRRLPHRGDRRCPIRAPARCWCATPSCRWTPTCAAG